MSGVELIEPAITIKRGNFRQAYAVPKDKRAANCARTRLLDCMIALALHEDAQYFDNAGPGEFAVVDVVTKEKAWFQMPFEATPDTITGMIASHFDAPAFRVGPRLWFV